MASRPIQTQPQGLLGFLQLKNAGQNPATLPDELAAHLDLLYWYLQTNSEILAGVDAAITVVGASNHLTVPQGEYWFVHDVKGSVQLAAAATWEGYLVYRNGPSGLQGTVFGISPEREWDQAITGTVASPDMTRERPLFVPPGGLIGFNTLALSAATTAANVVARITRLKV